MSKELEAFNKLMEESPEVHIESYEIVKKALERLESIDNPMFSEALDDIEEIIEELHEQKVYGFAMKFGRIKHAIIKAQEQEKALSIVKEKCVSVWHLMKSKTVEEYNSYLYIEGIEDTKNFILTEEEFELLKEHFK